MRKFPTFPATSISHLLAALLLGGCMGEDKDSPAPLGPPSAYAGADTVVGPRDTVWLRARGSDEAGRGLEWAWDIGATGRFVEVAGGDTLAVSGAEPGVELHVLRARTEDGRTALDTLRVTVERNVPQAYAGEDTAVTILDTVRLRGRARQPAARVVKWEWDVGNTGVFRAVASGDTDVVSMDSVGFDYHVLRITDEDGYSTQDTLRVTVRDDRPQVTLSWVLRKAAEGGGYQLSSKVVERGRILKWEWDLGDSVFRVGVGPDTGFRPKGSAGTVVRVRVRATDDDGHQAEAEEWVTASDWEYLTELPARFTAEGVDFSNTKLVAAKGRIFALAYGTGTRRSTFASFDPSTGEWTGLSPHPRPSNYAGLGVLDGKVLTFSPREYASGPTLVHEYDSRLDEWTELKNIPETCVNCSGVEMDSGLFLVGGELRAFGRYRPESGGFEPGPAFPGERWSRAATSLDGKIFAIDRGTRYEPSRMYTYTPWESEWKELSRVPAFPEKPALVAVAGGVYVLGGSNERWVHRYDPATASWTRLPDMVMGAKSQAAVVLDGKIYALWEKFIQRYDPAVER